MNLCWWNCFVELKLDRAHYIPLYEAEIKPEKKRNISIGLASCISTEFSNSISVVPFRFGAGIYWLMLCYNKLASIKPPDGVVS
jgi:hypothetical protein